MSWFESDEHVEIRKREVTALESIARSLRILVKEEQPKNHPNVAVEFGQPVNINSEETKDMSKPGAMRSAGGSGSFNANANQAVPFSVVITNQDGSPYVFQTGDVLLMESTDGHSTVNPNSADPTGETGSITDTAGFSGPLAGDAKFTPGPASVAAGVQPATGTWTGTFNPVTNQVSIAINFGQPA